MPDGSARGQGKKLKDVARAWATGGRGGRADPDDPHAAAIAAKLASRSGPADDAILEIGPDEVDVVALFFSLETQWRRHAMTGAAIGLDYTSIPSTASLAGIATTPALFADLQVMERAVLSVVAAAS